MPNTPMPNTATVPLAVQLYSLRFLTDPLDTILGQVAALGYQGVETIGDHGLEAAALRDLLDKHNLKACSSHAGFTTLEENPEKFAKFNLAIGNDVVVVPALPQEVRPTTAEGWAAMGKRLAAIGAKLAGQGVRLLYHNHAWEMELLDGKPAVAWMLDAAPAQHLQWEPDLAWIVAGQADPVALLKQYAGRCPRIHVKDLSPAGTNEEEKGFADVGYGTLDWAALLPAAKAAGGEWFIVEHDLPQHPLRTIQRSIDFLKSRAV